MPPSRRQIKIAPSILAADFAEMGRAVRETEAAGAEAIHIDVMDGSFVPEISFGRRMLEAVRRHTSLPLDVHLMVVSPERHIGPFADSGANAITVHLEATTVELEAALGAIRSRGLVAGVALKPATGADALDDLRGSFDRVLVMTVEPGYSGQAFMPDMLPKIEVLARRLREARSHVEIAVDGGVDEGTAPACVRAGATFLVAGSSIYSARRSVAAGIRALRAAVS
jgi:ribulose-phosphate 3-epimerase